jgi:hypothetical protein
VRRVIRTTALIDEHLAQTGLGIATAIAGTSDAVTRELADGRPDSHVDRRSTRTFHYIVVSGATGHGRSCITTRRGPAVPHDEP